MYYDKSPKRRSIFSYVVVALIAALIGGIISPYIANKYLYGKILEDPNQIEGKQQEQNINIETNDNINTVSAVADKAMSSVVGITTVQVQRELLWEREVEGLGSGFIVDPDGYILTNSHVVGDGEAKKINVLFENGDTHEAELLWNDSTLDLAMIKVELIGLKVAELGDSDKLKVGEVAVAIGNPLGLEFQRTVTSGVVSGLNRSMRIDEFNTIDNLIQTDASINPGNSGGPLLNSKGEVIGINTVKIKSQVAEGLGFSIPINIAKPIIESVIKEGTFKTVQLGITGTEIEHYQRSQGVDLGVDKGIVVIGVAPDSTAESLGLQQGDVLTMLDGKEIENMNQLKKILYEYKDGDKVEIKFVRGGKEVAKEAELKVIQ